MENKAEIRKKIEDIRKKRLAAYPVSRIPGLFSWQGRSIVYGIEDRRAREIVLEIINKSIELENRLKKVEQRLDQLDVELEELRERSK